MSRPTPIRMILAGLILAGLPFVAIAQHWHITAKDVRFELPVDLSVQTGTDSLIMSSELHELDLTELAGTDNIHKWDKVYIHMAQGPGLVAYPFGISLDRPHWRRGHHAFSVAATVVNREDKIIQLRYNFDRFAPTGDMKPLLRGADYSGSRVEIAVNRQSTARLVAIELNDERYPYLVMEKPLLKDLILFARPKNPPS